MAKSEQVLIRITPERKDEWESELEDSRFSSLAEFIRFAVNNEIEGRGSGSEVDTDTFAEVLDDTNEGIEGHHNAVMKRLSAIESAVGGVQEDLDGLVDVGQNEIVELLPTIKPTDYQDDDGFPITGSPTENINDRIYDDAMSASDVADRLGYPTEPVKRTLQRLSMKSERVENLYNRDTEVEVYYLNV
jgi:hypothetical protein